MISYPYSPFGWDSSPRIRDIKGSTNWSNTTAARSWRCFRFQTAEGASVREKPREFSPKNGCEQLSIKRKKNKRTVSWLNHFLSKHFLVKHHIWPSWGFSPLKKSWCINQKILMGPYTTTIYVGCFFCQGNNSVMHPLLPEHLGETNLVWPRFDQKVSGWFCFEIIEVCKDMCLLVYLYYPYMNQQLLRLT